MSNQQKVLYRTGTVRYCAVQCKNFIRYYGPIDAMVSSQGDDPLWSYILLIKYSNHLLLFCRIKLLLKAGGAADVLLLLPLKLRSGGRGPFAVWGVSDVKQL